MGWVAYIRESDERILRHVERWRPSPWARAVLAATARATDGWHLAVAAGLLLAMGVDGQRIVAAAALSTAIAAAVLMPLKGCVRRKRPYASEAPPTFAIKPPEYFRGDGFSFPSGHATSTFAFASAVAIMFPLVAPAAIILAASVAASRVLIGLHFTSDVTAGAALGCASGLLGSLLLMG